MAGSYPTNAVDLVVLIGFLAIAFLLPAAGYVCMVLDLRAYLRTLRRGLIKFGSYVFDEHPAWACNETPRAIAALGLRLPCSEADLKHAYRQRVKRLHPDHGGDQRRFLLLQSQFEEAMAIIGHGR
jgi:hypothetical protein